MGATQVADRQLKTAPGGGSSFFGQATVDFGNAGGEPESVTVTVADAGVSSSSKIVASIAGPADGREFDEMEMDRFSVVAGNIQNGVSFDLIVHCLTGAAHGQFLVNYTR